MKQPLEIGRELGGLYLVDYKLYTSTLNSSSLLPSSSTAVVSMSSSKLWHCRLGHMSSTNMKHIDVISSCKALPHSICQVCHYAKQQIIPFPDRTSYTTHLFRLIHVD